MHLSYEINFVESDLAGFIQVRAESSYLWL